MVLKLQAAFFLACTGLVLVGCAPATDTGDNANGGNQNDNTTNDSDSDMGTGNTVDDLPDLSENDSLGEGEGQDVSVPGVVLVGFDQSIDRSLFLQLAESTATTINGQVLDVLPQIHVVSYVVEPGTESAAIILAGQLDNVDYAEANAAGRLAEVTDLLPNASSVQFAQYQLFVTNAIRARGLQAEGTGGITVAVLDSGATLSHAELAGGSVISGFDYVNASSDVGDETNDGHGTGVVSLLAANSDAQVMAGLLPGFNVTVHKVCDADGFCSLDAVVIGLLGAISGNADTDVESAEIVPADIINCSFSFSSQYQTLARAIFAAEDGGVAVVAAAGNNGRSESAQQSRYPAGYSTVISVGATNIEDVAAPFSNQAADIDVVAPGVDVLVADRSGGYRFANGTSVAAAQVSAAAAWLLEREPGLTPADIKSRLQLRGDALPSGAGFDSSSARRLNFSSVLEDQNAPFEPYIIPDDLLVAATGVDTGTLAAPQAGQSAGSPSPEAFSGDTLHWYGYFGGRSPTFELIDGETREIVTPQSIESSTIDLFLTFVRGISLGSLSVTFGVMQEVVLEMPELGGERRTVEIVATVDGVTSDSRTLVYNPLTQGYNIVAYKNANSSVWHSIELEGDDFDPDQSDITLVGSGSRPEISWAGIGLIERVQVGSSLDPVFYVVSDPEDPLTPPLLLGECVGLVVPEQVCGESIELAANELTRIVVTSTSTGGTQLATLEVIYVP